MKITELLLDTTNKTACNGSTVGALIAAAGKTALWSERRTRGFDVVVIHYVSAVVEHPADPYKLEYILAIFCRYKVSSHYLIDREGAVYRFVPDTKKAWHAGGSIMPEPDNRQDVNNFSIGIELLATESGGFLEAQYQSLAELCGTIEQSGGTKITYVGHDAISGQRAYDRGLRNDIKIDPGPNFDWVRFFKALESNGNVYQV